LINEKPQENLPRNLLIMVGQFHSSEEGRTNPRKRCQTNTIKNND
jgi:hypothetical protein